MVVRRRGYIWLGLVLIVCVGLSACSRGAQQLSHTVRRGETLSEIGVQYGIPFREIARLNQIANPDKILAGQQLRIPHGGQKEQAEQAEQAERKTALPQSELARRRASVQKLAAERQSRSRRQARARPDRPLPKLSASLPKIPVRRRTESAQPSHLALPTGNSRFIWPAAGTLTSQYGPRNKSHHDGIDIAAPVGTPVVAAAPGEVIYSGVLRGYGKVIIVRHGKGYASVYAHNSANHVKQGQVVKQGQKLAEIGKTGRATAPNLHFEIRRNNKAQNPLKFLPPNRRIVSR